MGEISLDSDFIKEEKNKISLLKRKYVDISNEKATLEHQKKVLEINRQEALSNIAKKYPFFRRISVIDLFYTIVLFWLVGVGIRAIFIFLTSVRGSCDIGHSIQWFFYDHCPRNILLVLIVGLLGPIFGALVEGLLLILPIIALCILENSLNGKERAENKICNDSFDVQVSVLDNKIRKLDETIKELNTSLDVITNNDIKNYLLSESLDSSKDELNLYSNENFTISSILSEANIEIEEEFINKYLICQSNVLSMDNNVRIRYLSLINELINYYIGDINTFITNIDDLKQNKIRAKYFYNQNLDKDTTHNKYFGCFCKEIVKNIDNIKIWYNEFITDYSIIKSGADGEDTVADMIQNLCLNSICHHNIRLNYKGVNNELDVLVISVYGIFSIEVKNYHRKKITFTADGNWIETIYDYDKHCEVDKVSDFSPVAQNERHALYLEDLINTEIHFENINYIPVKGIVVIANNETEIENNGNYIISRASNIINEIRKNEVIFTKEQLYEIEKAILKYETDLEKFDVRNFLSANDTISFVDILSCKEMYVKMKHNRKLYDKLETDAAKKAQEIVQSVEIAEDLFTEANLTETSLVEVTSADKASTEVDSSDIPPLAMHLVASSDEKASR